MVCVFDAYGQGELADKIEDHYGMSVVFTRDTADSYIEKETLRLSQEDMTGRAPQRVWAATSDRAIQISASVHGATVVSSPTFTHLHPPQANVDSGRAPGLFPGTSIDCANAAVDPKDRDHFLYSKGGVYRAWESRDGGKTVPLTPDP